MLNETVDFVVNVVAFYTFWIMLFHDDTEQYEFKNCYFECSHDDFLQFKGKNMIF